MASGVSLGDSSTPPDQSADSRAKACIRQRARSDRPRVVHPLAVSRPRVVLIGHDQPVVRVIGAEHVLPRLAEPRVDICGDRGPVRRRSESVNLRVKHADNQRVAVVIAGLERDPCLVGGHRSMLQRQGATRRGRTAPVYLLPPGSELRTSHEKGLRGRAPPCRSRTSTARRRGPAPLSAYKA